MVYPGGYSIGKPCYGQQLINNTQSTSHSNRNDGANAFVTAWQQNSSSPSFQIDHFFPFKHSKIISIFFSHHFHDHLHEHFHFSFIFLFLFKFLFIAYNEVISNQKNYLPFKTRSHFVFVLCRSTMLCRSVDQHKKKQPFFN